MPDPANNNVKQTPGRRRPGQNANRTSASRRNYASENDASAAERNFQPDFLPRGQGRNQGGQARNQGQGQGQGPTTPKKSAPRGPSQGATGAPSSATKSNNKRNPSNRPNSKKISTSPAPARTGGRTPPQTAGVKPTSTAFAGATFHASPAPASLPLPSFYVKNNNSPGTPHAKSASSSGLQEPSPPVSDSEVQAAAASSGNTAETRGEGTPLAFLFHADRAEKERARRASSANLSQAPVGPYSPPAQMVSVNDHVGNNTFPAMPPQQQQQQQPRPGGLQHVRHQSAGFSYAELDSNPGMPIGPAFSTPFQERIRAIRPNDGRAPMAPGQPGMRDLASGSAAVPPPHMAAAPVPQPTHGADGRTEALKRFLFSTNGSSFSGVAPGGSASGPAPPPPISTMPPHQNIHPTAHSMAPVPASAYQSVYATPPRAPAAAPHANNGQPNNIAAMEDSLRQILNLDSSFGGSPAYGTRQ